jgi:hypothetical protein
MLCFFKSVEKKKKNHKLLEHGENIFFLLSLIKEMKTTSEYLKIDETFVILNIFFK